MDDNSTYTGRVRVVGQNLIDLYRKTGIVECGVNGPYNDPETRVRDLAHLIIVTACEIIIYGKNEYEQTLKAMGDELLSLSDDGIYLLRKKASKDTCNGVIGHAWIIEALVYLYKVFEDEEYLDWAFSIIQKHNFNKELCLWNRPTNNSALNIDYTLNHQLWFAAALAEFNKYYNEKSLKLQLDTFMNNLCEIFLVSKDGRITHNILARTRYIDTLKQKVKKCIIDFEEQRNSPSMAYKEAGYHAFNLMALARIYMVNKNYSFFESKKFKKSLSYLNSNLFLSGLNDSRYDLDKSLVNSITDKEELSINIYGYPYNVPGFELLYIRRAFGDCVNTEIVDCCLKEQFDYTYEQERFSNRCFDKIVINYRTYEYYRFLEVDE